MKINTFVKYYLETDLIKSSMNRYEKQLVIDGKEITDDMFEPDPHSLGEKFWELVKNKIEEETDEKIELAYGCHYIIDF